MGHHDVEQDEIRLPHVDLAEGLGGVGRLDDLVTLVSEQPRHQSAYLGIVVDHEHECSAGSHSN